MSFFVMLGCRAHSGGQRRRRCNRGLLGTSCGGEKVAVVALPWSTQATTSTPARRGMHQVARSQVTPACASLSSSTFMRQWFRWRHALQLDVAIRAGRLHLRPHTFKLTTARPLGQSLLRAAAAPAPALPPHPRSCSNRITASTSVPSSKVSLVHFNDVYNIEAREQDPVGGAARFVSRCRQLAQDYGALVLFSGDSFNPSLMSTVTKGAQMPPVLNAAGVQAAAVGNHDLDFGLSRFAQLSAECTFPWLMANLLDKRTSDVFPGCKRYHIIDHQGVRIGLIGLVEYEWLATMPLLEVDDVLYLDFVEEGRRLSHMLREECGADMVIALTHMRAPNDLQLGAQVPGIDLILGGHDHHYSIERCHPKDTLLFKSGTDFRELSLIHMSRDDSRWVVDYERIVVDSHVPEDPSIAQLVAEHSQELDKQLDAPAGPTAVPLDGRFVMVRTREVNLGNLVADIALTALNVDPRLPVDCTLINSGTLRSDTVHAAGQLSKKDLVNILPMMDEMMVIQASGSVLLRALEVGVSAYPRLEGRFLQVGNIAFSFDAALPPGRRIMRESVLVGGAALNLSRLYAVGVKKYLVQGKDGFDCLSDCPVLRCDEECQQLALMVSEHFERLQDINKKLRAGKDVSNGADPAIRRLLRLASKAAGNESSSIIRFFPERGMYAADPAVERRITKV
eukprot:jgi/Ulvmu1/7330/UM035_0119.1